MKHFTPTQLLEHLKTIQNAKQAALDTSQNMPLLLDVREPWEFDICHIENSTLMPMGQIQTLCDTLDKEKETVVICHHGIRSRQVAMYLERLGFSNVINLTGGVDAWAQEVDLHMEKY